MAEESDKQLQASAPQAEIAKPEPPVSASSLQSVLSKVPEQDAKTILSLALSRTSFGYGPDAETVKILADTEMHEETCRLKGFEASLANKDKQAERDHDFRKRKLRHQSLMTAGVLLVTVAGVGSGLWLSATGNAAIGNPVLVASFTVLTTMAGKLIAARDKD